MAFSPNGSYLATANRGSSNVTLFDPSCIGVTTGTPATVSTTSATISSTTTATGTGATATTSDGAILDAQSTLLLALGTAAGLALQ